MQSPGAIRPAEQYVNVDVKTKARATPCTELEFASFLLPTPRAVRFFSGDNRGHIELQERRIIGTLSREWFADIGTIPAMGTPERAPYIEIVRSVDMTTEIINQVSLDVINSVKKKCTDTV